MQHTIKFFRLFSLLLGLFFLNSAWAQQPVNQEFQNELAFSEYAPNPSKNLHTTLIWLWSEHGPQSNPLIYAQQLSQAGFKVVIPALFESYFLPHLSSSLAKIPKKTLWQFIQSQQAKTQQTYVITSDKTASLVLKTVALSQQPHQNLGLILINPNTYIRTPEAGEKALYQPEVTQTNLPIYILQSQRSPWRWHLHELRQKLMQGHSDVFTQILPKVRDRFYFRPDALPYEKEKAHRFAMQIFQATKLLSPYLAVPRPLDGLKATLTAKTQPISNSTPDAKKTHAGEITIYTGPQNLPLNLKNLNHQPYDLKSYQGQVVLLNFWASWCPPCVHEMPSMARLNTAFKRKKFSILAVNLGEDKADIDTFLQAHPINFPILRDTKGKAVQNWHIFAYPSTFIIDKKGRIRYALFGGYEWDNHKAKRLINQLLEE